MDERSRLVIDLLTALPPVMTIHFGHLTHTGDATSFVREHIRAAAMTLGIDVENNDAGRAVAKQD